MIDNTWFCVKGFNNTLSQECIRNGPIHMVLYGTISSTICTIEPHFFHTSYSTSGLWSTAFHRSLWSKSIYNSSPCPSPETRLLQSRVRRRRRRRRGRKNDWRIVIICYLTNNVSISKFLSFSDFDFEPPVIQQNKTKCYDYLHVSSLNFWKNMWTFIKWEHTMQSWAKFFSYYLVVTAYCFSEKY